MEMHARFQGNWQRSLLRPTSILWQIPARSFSPSLTRSCIAVSLSSLRMGMESPGQKDLRSHLGVAKPFTVERPYACDAGGDDVEG